jgi:DNA-binding transcriptional regulator GbsR (MarR family)
MTPVVRRFVEEAGKVTQSLGAGRVIGQLYAFLYFSPRPRGLADMQQALGISKGSASMAVRQLEQWGAVHKVWIRGDRRDYYEASDWFGRILKNALMDNVGKQLDAYAARLEQAEAELASAPNHDPDLEYVRDRVQKLRRFQKRAQRFLESSLIRALLA